MRPFPLYHCVRCGQRRGYRLGIGGPWTCGGCRPVWALPAAAMAARSAIDTTPPAGIRPGAADADAGDVAAEHFDVCASQRRFLAAVAGG
jgi:hypothetical protein